MTAPHVHAYNPVLREMQFLPSSVILEYYQAHSDVPTNRHLRCNVSRIAATGQKSFLCGPVSIWNSRDKSTKLNESLKNVKSTLKRRLLNQF